MFAKIQNFIKNPVYYLTRASWLNYRQQISHNIAPLSWWDDRFYIEYKYYQIFEKMPNFSSPKSFNEKLQWIKLFDRNPLYTKLVDKYLVRKYVKDKIGGSYLNQLLGVYQSVEEINWNSLPNQFVLKTTHGCGQNIIGHNKAKLNIEQAKKDLSRWLTLNNYEKSREWPYKNVKARIICEEYIPWDRNLGLLDYKVYCFGGNPTYIDVHYGRYTEHKSIFYDTDWTRQPFGLIPKETEIDFLKPRKLSEMVEIAKELSKDIPFCRIDLYYVSEKIYFGEVTFFPGGGFLPFQPQEYNTTIGNMIELPHEKLR